MQNGKRCVLIVDDDYKFRRVINDFLNLKGFIVFCACDGTEALKVFKNKQQLIDLILLDVMMPNIDGFAVLSAIRKLSQVPIIMLTAKSEDYDQYIGFQKGADDYISKPFSTLLLNARIEAVLRRANKEVNNDIIIVGKLKLAAIERRVYYDGQEINLTNREYNLLYYLMINKGFTLTREQILNGAWGHDFEGDIRTVDTHIKQLRLKIDDGLYYIRTIHRVGYRMEEN